MKREILTQVRFSERRCAHYIENVMISTFEEINSVLDILLQG